MVTAPCELHVLRVIALLCYLAVKFDIYVCLPFGGRSHEGPNEERENTYQRERSEIDNENMIMGNFINMNLISEAPISKYIRSMSIVFQEQFNFLCRFFVGVS